MIPVLQSQLAAARAVIAQQDAQSVKLARWIIQHCDHWTGDHACAECFPSEASTVEGFRCAVHVARDIAKT